MLEIDRDQARWLRDFFCGNIDGEHQMTMSVLKACPAEALFFRPEHCQLAFVELAVRIYADGLRFLRVAQAHNGTPDEPPEAADLQKPALIDICRDWHHAIMDGFRDLSDRQLVTDIDFNVERFPAVFMADWHVVNMVHHRGMLCSYLEMREIDVPRVYLR